MEKYGNGEPDITISSGGVEICPEKELNKGAEVSSLARRGGRSRILCDVDNANLNSFLINMQGEPITILSKESEFVTTVSGRLIRTLRPTFCKWRACSDTDED